MHKKIIFLLLAVASTTNNGMESESSLQVAFSNPDIAWRVTEHLCMNHRRNPKNLKRDIRTLYETNTQLHTYYSDEKTMQRIIDKGARIYYSGQYRTAIKVLGCHTITKKINHFCDIASNEKIQFSENDLQDPWYFSINLSLYNDKSLLYRLIETLQFEKADTVITHSEKIDFGWHKDNYLLKLISEMRQKTSNKKIRSELLRITERLLREKSMPADGTFLPLTALMDASQNNDQPFAQLLLWYGAKPHKRRGNFSFAKNALEIEKGEPKGWLKAMITSNKLYKYWAIKNYMFDESKSLPQDIMQIIMRIRQQLYYHYERYTNHTNPLCDIIRKRYSIKEQVTMDVSREFTQKHSTCYTDEYGQKCIKIPSGIVHKNGFIEDTTMVGFQIDVASFLEDHVTYNNLLKKAERLLQKGFMPNFRHKNIDKATLMIAIENYDQQMIRLLLEFGASPSLTGYNETTKQIEDAFGFAHKKI